MSEINSSKITSNVVWRLLERFGSQIVSLVVSVILARLLTPNVYGTVALVTVFTNILQVFVDSGLGNALIQKKDADNIDFSSVFYFNIVFCLFLYGLMFSFAPLIAKLYDMPELVKVIRVLSLILVISGIKNIQQAYVSKKLLFKRFFYATLIGTIGSAIIGIYMAYKGYGVWALVASNLSGAAINTVVLWVAVGWKPDFVFSFKRLKGLLSYGIKLLFARIVEVGYSQIHSLVIGKKYTTADLAFFNKGRTYPNMLVTNIDTSLTSVMFPAMAEVQDDKEKLKNLVKKSINLNMYVVFPCMMGFAVCAKSIVSIVLSDKWLPAVPYIMAFCFVYAFAAFNTSNMNLFRAIGASGTYLKVETARKFASIIILLITVWFGPIWIAIGEVVSTVFMMIITAAPSKKYIGYGFLAQLLDVVPVIVLTLVMCLIIYAVEFLKLSTGLTLIIQIILGVVVYVVGSKIFRFYQFDFFMGFLKKVFKKRATK